MKEEEEKRKKEELENQNQKPKKKKFAPKSVPAHKRSTDDIEYENEGEGQAPQNEEEKKEENSKLKKYFKNRYISFLKTLKEDNVKKKEEEEKARLKEERLKNKMLQKLGMENVQSRFLAEVNTTNQEDGEPPKVKRSASNMDSTRTHNNLMSKTSYGDNLGTPKNSLRNRLTEVKAIDEKVNNEEKKKELKAKKEANERIKKKQADYLRSLAEK